ncbi:altered inheritance of mitochondria protein 29 [Rhizoctonia solani]|uniref:Altered inheritance of mitochondria protein 29 n=1 Tax=Rhizoctonia solani TaxID=456999 RepID=A0A8H8P9S7_9AGAM|nr:altered inheritance of mitochondria protein 29 [Rhizoctonia solani]QRW27423.1 altered inheritance of mitochondria protein 29 [Rhizoctonia solani]
MTASRPPNKQEKYPTSSQSRRSIKLGNDYCASNQVIRVSYGEIPVIHALDLEHTTVGELKERVRNAIKTEPGWKPYRTVQLDTLKLYTKAHGAKTTNLIINLDHDDWILNDDSAILASLGFENETEVSFFNRELYEAFKKDPTTKW